ncbi:MAG: DUF6657 family protein [Spirochaetota bacterium]
MSEIKSALELALERTADVKGDRSSLEAHESRQTGMRLAGKFMEDPSMDIATEFNQVETAKRAGAKSGFFHVMLSHLALPNHEADLQRFQSVHQGLKAVIADEQFVDGLMDQVTQYLQQYLETKNQLTERLRQQFQPRIKQKEQQIAQQTGRQVRLDPANDPEFAQALNQNIGRLQEQYGQVIDQAKEQLEQLFQASR